MLINGKEIPESEVAAAYQRAQTLEQEVTQLRTTAATTNQQLAEAERAKAAIERASTDPAFARQLVDGLRLKHEGSAYMADLGGGQQQEQEPPANDGGEQNPPAPPAPTGGPTVTAPSEGSLEYARQIEDLRRQVQQMQGDAALKSKLEDVSAAFPMVDTEALVLKAVELNYPLEHLSILAQAIDRDRVSADLTKAGQNDDLLTNLLNGVGAASGDVDSALASLGSSLSANVVTGDGAVDFGEISTADAVMLAMKQVGAASEPATI